MLKSLRPKKGQILPVHIPGLKQNDWPHNVRWRIVEVLNVSLYAMYIQEFLLLLQ